MELKKRLTKMHYDDSDEYGIAFEIDFFPSGDELKFKKGEEVSFENSEGILDNDIISKISFTSDYDLEILDSSEIDDKYLDILKDNFIEINKNITYIFNFWKPTYILNRTKEYKFEHELYHKSK